MNTIPAPGPLDEAELDRLAQWLLDCPGAMNLEMLDGFFTALLCCPEMAMPSQYLPLALGTELAPAETQQGLELTMRHWNAIAGSLAGASESGQIHAPVLLEDEDDTLGELWAIGFTQGMAMCPVPWGELAEDEIEAGALLPILILAHENHPDPQLRSTPVKPELREALVDEMVIGVMRIYRYFRAGGGYAAPRGRRPGTASGKRKRTGKRRTR